MRKESFALCNTVTYYLSAELCCILPQLKWDALASAASMLTSHQCSLVIQI